LARTDDSGEPQDGVIGQWPALSEVRVEDGLADPSATVEAVPQLERHPATGKLRRFVAA